MASDFVITNKTAAMQRLADLATKKYTFYVAGQIHRDKVKDFSSRMDHYYSVHDSAMQKSRKNKKGYAKFALLFLATEHPSIKPDHFLWFLVRTNGTMPAHVTNEQWLDAKDKKIKITDYELVRITRPGAKFPSWSWRYTLDQFNALNSAVISAVRLKDDKELERIIYTLKSTPGFAGARRQVFKLYGTLLSEFKRHRGKEKPPVLPRIGYVRRVATVGRPAKDVNRRRAVRKSVLK